MRKKYKKILLLGSGALKIGQAGEFDYSGSQAIKALKEEGIRTILINPNIATIQTSEKMADRVYFLPVDINFVKSVIEKERPDGILLGFGGQTALNVGLELEEKGVLKEYNVEVLGTSVDVVRKTEDRDKFVREMNSAGLKTPSSVAVTMVHDAIDAAAKLGYPVMLRAGFALGGENSGVVYNEDQLISKAEKAISSSGQLLIEEYLGGWKEVEYEVVRDNRDNCIVVCSMENFDPMGIHTGESIVVAPVQTLSSKENFMLRSVAIKAIRHLGIVGECNIQYALDPETGDYRIIEVNPRLSRSSALASKATGYPLAYVAAKLGIGTELSKIKNVVTGDTSAFFEPALDYCVVKFPRWDLQKFSGVDDVIGSEMKSVGEVMSIGRNFEEAIQKAIRMLDKGMPGITGASAISKNLENELKNPTDKRIFAVAEALKNGYTIPRIYEITKITPWFLGKINNIVKIEKMLQEHENIETLPNELLREAKQKGFSDRQIAKIYKLSESEVRSERKKRDIIPFVKQIDTMAGEYPAETNYLYITYNGDSDDISFSEKEKVIVLGSGAYRIGSSVEFDWCCVNSMDSLKQMKYTTVMINCNPETVSTDYDMCDKLYFEELSLERVLDIAEKENPLGVIISMGGQIPNNLTPNLHNNGVKILGTAPADIDRAENRHKFSALLDDLNIDQPEWKELTSLEEAEKFAENVGYPVLIRPSYVLSGAAMNVAENRDELTTFLGEAAEINSDYPVVISRFIQKAREIEIDAVGENGELYCYAVSEHVENAGVHSGDATMVLPPQRTWLETMRRVKLTTRKIAKALNITGPFNIQFIAKDNEIKVIECNLRASRSFPFVSKIYNLNFIDIATQIIMGRKLQPVDRSSFDMDYVGVKAPQFSFSRLRGTDPVLGVEMASTGEVGCIGEDLYEAFLKSMISVGYKIPEKSVHINAATPDKMAALIDVVKNFSVMGYEISGDTQTAAFFHQIGIEMLISDNLSEIKTSELVISIPGCRECETQKRDYDLRRKAVEFKRPLITKVKIAKTFAEAVKRYREGKFPIKAWDEYRH